MRSSKQIALVSSLIVIFVSGAFSQGFDFVPQKGHKDAIESIQYSPDGKKILSLGILDNKMTLWDVATGKEYASVVDKVYKIYSAVIAPDGKSIVAARSNKKVIEILDFATLKPAREFGGYGMQIDKLMPTPDSRHCLALFSAYGYPQDYKLIDLGTGAARYEGKTKETIVASALSADGRFFALSDFKGKVFLHDQATGKEIGSFEVKDTYINALCFSPDGNSLGGGASKGEFFLWSTERLALTRSASAHNSGIRSCAFSPDGRRIFLCGEGSSIAALDSATLAPLFDAKRPEWVLALSASPDGGSVAIGDRIGSISILDAFSGTETKTLGGRGGNVKNVAFNPKRNELVHDSYSDVRAVSMDSLNSSIVAEVQKKSYTGYGSTKSANESNIQEMAFSKDGRYLATNSIDELEIRVFDGTTYKQIGAIAYDRFFEHETFTFLPDGSALVCGVKDRKNERIDLCFYELPGMKKTRTIPTKITSSYGIEKIVVAPDQGRIAALGYSDSLMPYFIWDLASGEPVAQPKLKSYRDIWELGKGFAVYPVSACADFSRDGTFVAAGDTKGFVRLYDASSGAQVWAAKIYPDFGGGTFIVKALRYDPEGRHLVAAGMGADIVVLDPKTGAVERRLKGHLDTVNSLDFSADGKILASASDDSFVKLWDYASGEARLNFVSSGPEDWLAFSDEGFFDGSRNGGDGVAIVARETKAVYNVDQFAIEMNRPDRLLAKAGSKDAELIDHFQAQYLRRIRKFGLSAANAGTDGLPTCAITSVARDGDRLDLGFSLRSEKRQLLSYNVYVNNVPLFGSLGKKLSGRLAEIKEKIELGAGNNKIEVSAIDEAGLESYRASASIPNQRKPKADLYYIGFGVSKYADSRLDLNYADKDAADLASALKKRGANFGTVNAHTFLNEAATVANVKRAREILAKSKPDDVVILFIAGHGMHDKDKDSTYYFLTHETKLDDLAGSAADFELIEGILQGIPARNKLFLMDTCESGEVEEETERSMVAFETKNKNAVSRSIPGARGLMVVGEERKVRTHLFDRNRFIYNDLSRRSGAIVLSSCKGGEYSYEDSTLKNGYFTSKLKEILAKEKYLSVDALNGYVMSEVPKMSGNLQNPTVDRDNIYQKFGF